MQSCRNGLISTASEDATSQRLGKGRVKQIVLGMDWRPWKPCPFPLVQTLPYAPFLTYIDRMGRVVCETVFYLIHNIKSYRCSIPCLSLSTLSKPLSRKVRS